MRRRVRQAEYVVSVAYRRRATVASCRGREEATHGERGARGGTLNNYTVGNRQRYRCWPGN
eukprot:2055013-Pleurochrysis_carterae.AAC.1